MFSALMSKLVRAVQFSTEAYVRDRDWWRDADPSWVVLVIAGRAFVYSLILLVTAVGLSLYRTPRTFDIANALVLAASIFSAYLLVFSACRAGDALALYFVRDADPHARVAPWVRMLTLAVAVLGLSIILWCVYCVVIGLEQQSRIAFVATLMAGLYLFAGATRAFAMLRQSSFYPTLVERVYGASWRGFKNFRRL
jgi:hypothetical protein